MRNWIWRTALGAVCALALAVPAAAEGGFADVPETAWYADAAAVCRDRGLLSPSADGRFDPDGPLTRGDLARALHRLAGSPAAEGTPFPDAEGDAAAWARQRGVLTGYADGTFRPEAGVTRQQLAAALWRFAGSPETPAEDYADEADIAPYALGAVDWARSTGLMSGGTDGRFAPQARASRAHGAKVLAAYAARLGTVSRVSAMDVMCQPSGLAAMEDGSLLVTDVYDKVLWRVADRRSQPHAGADTAEDLYGEPVGGYYDAARSESLFKEPWAAAPFLGGWAVSDPGNGVVRFLRPEAGGRGRTEVTDLGVPFDHPTGLAADSEGNLYAAETLRGAIIKITPEGVVTTLASRLSEPMGLCWADGYLYVAECGGCRVLKISPDREVTTVAGSGVSGSADGPAARAQFSGPKGVAVDRDGTVYVADTDNGAVRRIQNGQVDTVLSRDPRDVTALYPAGPRGLLIQGDTLYIADTFARKLLAMPLR